MPDLVDCAHLAQEGAVLERVYELGDLLRMRDMLADPQGTLTARFAFSNFAARPGARVMVEAAPCLVCQRCMQPFRLPVSGGSELEFAPDDDSRAEVTEREVVGTQNGLVSLRELAEEELLLALPIAPACGTPWTCGRAPDLAAGAERPTAADDSRRPFSSLRDLLKKT